MTVCTAAIFRWAYDPEEKDVGPAIITAADRMLTDEGLGIEFERFSAKSGHLTDKAMVLAGGSIVVHSRILKEYMPILTDPIETDIPKIADGYGKRIRDYRAERAAEAALSVFKLDNETFVSRQKDLEPKLVMDLANEMRDYRISAEALVVGCDDRRAHLYHISDSGHKYRRSCDLLAARNGCHDKQRLRPARDRVWKGLIGRLQREISLTSEEPQERAATLGGVIANGSAQDRIMGFERIEHGTLRHHTFDCEPHLAIDVGMHPQM